MVFHGFWLVSMVFQIGFMVFHGFWSVSMIFQVGFMVLHSFWLVSMGFRGGFMVFHSFLTAATKQGLHWSEKEKRSHGKISWNFKVQSIRA